MAKDPQSLDHFASGSGDGVVKVWNLTSQEEIYSTAAHEGIVKGLVWTHNKKLLSCASDKSIKLVRQSGKSLRATINDAEHQQSSTLTTQHPSLHLKLHT